MLTQFVDGGTGFESRQSGSRFHVLNFFHLIRYGRAGCHRAQVGKV